MSDADVIRYGTDSSGRPILMTVYMQRWWEAIYRELGFEPTIVQGAWMARVGGGASESAGYHDGGGCLDLRVWDRTETQVVAMVHALRKGGAGAWVRDAKHGGFDPHLHFVLGSDHGLASGAAWQWLNYISGGDGLSSGGRDYHWRPTPLVTEPPDSLMEEPMQEADFTRISKIMREELARDNERDKRRWTRLWAELDALEAAVKDTASKDLVRRARDRIRKDLAEGEADTTEETA